MITEGQVQTAFRPHPQLDKTWVAKIAGCSVVTGTYCNGGNYDLYEICDRKGNIHGYLTMPQLLEQLNEKR